MSSFFNKSELTLILIHFIKYCFVTPRHFCSFKNPHTITTITSILIQYQLLIIVMFKHYAITGCTPVLTSPSKSIPDLPDSKKLFNTLILYNSFMVQLYLLSSTEDVCVLLCIPPINTCASSFSLGPHIRWYF